MDFKLKFLIFDFAIKMDINSFLFHFFCLRVAWQAIMLPVFETTKSVLEFFFSFFESVIVSLKS